MLTTTVQGRTWNFSHAIGHVGAAGETFLFPFSVVTADSGLMYVLNRGEDPKEGDGNRLSNPNFKRIGKWKLEDAFIVTSRKTTSCGLFHWLLMKKDSFIARMK